MSLSREISIHAPAWGATTPRLSRAAWRSFQSTRPRGARQERPGLFVLSYTISIHAPAWGATVAVVGLRALSRISIHAPAWGATVPIYTGLIAAVTLYFSRTSFLAVLLQAFFVAKSSV